MTNSPMTFAERLARIEATEKELTRKAPLLVSGGTPIAYSDLFVLGAMKRALSLSSGFRTLISERNTTCCAALLRMQIDTAARVNALKLVESMHAFAKAVIKGGRLDKQKSASGALLKDIYLIEQLSKDHPWVADVYTSTSGFVHLSDRHFFTAIDGLDDQTHTFNIAIGPHDHPRPDSDYFEMLDAFFEANRVSGVLILGYLHYRKAAIEGSVAEAPHPF